MRIYDFEETRYHEASDFFVPDYDLESLEKNVGATVKLFTKRRLFRELLGVWSEQSGLEGHILLHAHGCGDYDEWMFTDGKREHRMQSWIDRMDGQAVVLFLKSCNPHDYAVHSEQSLIIHPSDSVNVVDLIRGHHLRVFVPGVGYLDDNYYRLRKTIDLLK